MESHDLPPATGADEATGWVRQLLASHPRPTIPAEVTDRTLAALRAEQEARDAASTAKADPLAEIIGGAGSGTFGANPPSSYSPRGIGLADHLGHNS